MTYRVTYPLITQDGQRDFDTRKEAEKFAAERRNHQGPYSLSNDWRKVRVTEIAD